MLIAALTATERITAAAGAGALITLGTIQVALAMPEQIMGVIKNFILKSGDKVQAPDFAMTSAELDLKDELAVGMSKKVFWPIYFAAVCAALSSVFACCFLF